MHTYSTFTCPVRSAVGEHVYLYLVDEYSGDWGKVYIDTIQVSFVC